MRSKIGIAIGLVCCLVVGTRDASACECDLNPPCAAFWKADAVFVGIVTAHDVSNVQGQPVVTATTLRVLRMFRGEQLPSIVLSGRLTSCSYGFRIGETYLVYAARSADGPLNTSQCSGTKPLGSPVAEAEISTIQALPSLPPLGSIYGTVHRAVRDPETRAVRDGLAAGVRVTLASPGTRASVLTDQDGRFEFSALPSGTYSVQMVVPATESAPGREVVVTPRACSPLYLQNPLR